MGPRRIRRGEPQVGEYVTTAVNVSFNGATANSPWRTPAVRACTRKSGKRFNGATANSPWRTRRARSTIRRAAGFNGATANSPWRTCSSRSGRSRRTPWLQWGHGEFAVENAVPNGGQLVGVAELQWGHGEFAVENATRSSGTRSARWGFNGATANSPWRTTRPAVARAARGRGFNGATANSPWRTGHRQDILGGNCYASMGPRRIRRGERLQRPARQHPGGGASMGPRRIRRGERDWPKALKALDRKLQWGHGEFAVENVVSSAGRLIGREASMGPRRIRRGELPRPHPRCERDRELQWGHGEFAVENTTGRNRPPRD